MSGNSNSSGNNTNLPDNTTGSPSDSSENNENSSDNTTDSSTDSPENISEKLSRLGENAENISKIFVPVSAVISALSLFGYYIYYKGYREYFGIGDEWSSGLSLSSILNFVFIMLLVIAGMSPNFLTYALSNCFLYQYYKPKKRKINKFLKITLWILIYLFSIMILAYGILLLCSKFDVFNNFTVGMKISIVCIFWIFLFGFGFFMSWDNRPFKNTVALQQQSQTTQQQLESNKKIALYILLPIILGLVVLIVGFVMFNIYSEGSSNAQNQKEFKKIQIVDETTKETSDWVILTENDDKILLAELVSEDDGTAEINTKKQKIIENGEYEYDIILYENPPQIK
ncbi:MAG: hypothetical protein K2I00_03785 [Ruminococcus sp.]|nr:hypothetical protein [Ruminococcus sp.]